MTAPEAPRMSRWLWLWLPVVVVLVNFLARAIDPYLPWEPPALGSGEPGSLYEIVFESELGFMENMTALAALIAGLIGLSAFAMRDRLPRPWLGWWVLFLSLGCLFVAGEETSWGQHFFGWNSPEWFAERNDQMETNLHNVSSWLDQKPRTLVLLWIIGAGLVYPVLAQLRGWRFGADDWRAWFWPAGWILTPTAVLTMVARFPDDLNKLLGGAGTHLLTIRYSELQEMCFALFLMLYLLSIRQRLAALPPPART